MPRQGYRQLSEVTDSEPMSQLADKSDSGSLPSATLSSRLENVESEQQRVSERRRLLHDRIDHMLMRSGDSPEAQADLGAALHLEQKLSERRLELHQQITELRLEKCRRLTARR